MGVLHHSVALEGGELMNKLLDRVPLWFWILAAILVVFAGDHMPLFF